MLIPDGFPGDIPSGTVVYVPEMSLDLYRSLRPDLASRIEGMDYSNFNFNAQ